MDEKHIPTPEEAIDQEQASHDEEERAFRRDGWSPLDAARPFYMHPPGSDAKEGTRVTVASTFTRSPGIGFEWWTKSGDIRPPEGLFFSWSVYEIQGDRWVQISNGEASGVPSPAPSE